MSENNSGSRGGPEGSSPYGDQNQPQYGQNLPQYGQGASQSSEGQSQYGQQGASPYGDQSASPYGQQGQYGDAAAGYPGQQGGYAGQPAENPGRTLGIVGFILAIFLAPIGLIISIIGMVKSRKARMGNGFALAGIIIGVLFTILGAVIIYFIVSVGIEVAQLCEGVPSGGTVEYQGVPTQCP
ncbi:DUF4190 domain-containing protein [Arthrobacter sp. RIT-PI-e]|uniref:DUF4190 domain-containing protein n=1 Tax=Arthrobacter sp. RIT-PI-e TaxID=1681197 RepID=UPI00067688B1|nr:DUF4190 domain-containing protein [Arthrobacter sp. RIT-PI-e]